MFSAVQIAEVTITTPGSALLAAELGAAVGALLVATLIYLSTLWFVAAARRQHQDRAAAATPEHHAEAPRGATEVWARRDNTRTSDRLLDHSASR